MDADKREAIAVRGLMSRMYAAAGDAVHLAAHYGSVRDEAKEYMSSFTPVNGFAICWPAIVIISLCGNESEIAISHASSCICSSEYYTQRIGEMGR